MGNTGGLDLVQGPFPTSLAIQPGERIALQPIDDGNTPIVVGTVGFDGIRYFSGALPDGSASMLAPGADMDNGQVVPIQATVSFTPPPPPPPPPARTLTVTTSGSGTGTIAGAGIDCGGGAAHHACSTAYPDGTKVTLTATPSGASRFGGFTGGGCPAATPCTVSMNANQTVDGRFDGIPHPRKRKPAFLRFSLAPHAFRAAPVPPTIWPSATKSKWGTLIRFRLSDSAAVEFHVDECLPKPKRTRTLCYHPQRADSFAVNARRGTNVLRFTGFVARLGHSRVRRQGFSGSQLYPGHYRLETQTLAGPLRIRSDVKIQYITVPEVAPSLSALTLSSTKTTEGSNGQGATGITAFYNHTFSPSRPGDLVGAGKRVVTLKLVLCGNFASTGCSNPTPEAQFVSVDPVSGANQLNLTSYINGSPGHVLLGPGRYRLVLSAEGCNPVQADFNVFPKYIALGFPPPLALKPYSLPAAPSGGVTGPADFQSDFGTLVSFTEDRNYGSGTWTNVFHIFDSYGRWVAAIVVHVTAGRHTFYWSGISDLQGTSGTTATRAVHDGPRGVSRPDRRPGRLHDQALPRRPYLAPQAVPGSLRAAAVPALSSVRSRRIQARDRDHRPHAA